MADNTGLECISKAVDKFSKRLLMRVVEQQSENLTVSPLCAHLILSMAAYGAQGDTATQMRSLLNIPNNESLSLSGFKSLTTILNEVKNIELHVASKMFVTSRCVIQNKYKQLAVTKFLSGCEEIDFSKSPATAITIINDWCTKQTKNRVKEIVTAENVEENTQFMLLGAAYLKGAWSDPFDPNDTHQRLFHVTETTFEYVPTMFMRGYLKYGLLPECRARFIELPYKGNEFSMFIILPNDINGLNLVVESVLNLNLMDTLLNGETTEISLYLPRFKIETELDLTTILRKMGMTDMFESFKANFSGITDRRLHASKVIQKTVIEVDEKGNEPSAITLLKEWPCCRCKALKFSVDRPFLARIIHTSSNIVVFESIVTLPKY